MHGHLTEGAHNDQDGQATDDVGKHDGRAGHFDGFGRTEEETDTDTGAQRHKTDVPFAQFTLERAALCGLGMGRVVADWHSNTTSFCYWI